jgi:hypothetical protein
MAADSPPIVAPVAPVERAAGDPIPPACEVIEVHVADMRQLFNSIDPSPFRQRDLDADAEEFIVTWARNVSRSATIALLVHLDRPLDLAEEHAILQDAVRTFFRYRADSTRQRLQQLFRVGRISLLIGLIFLAAALAVGSLLANSLPGPRGGALLRESVLIGGWVAMWRPLEIFLYDWWPIRAQAVLFDRLSAMPVRVVQAQAAAPARPK